MNTFDLGTLELDKRWRGKRVHLRQGDKSGTTIAAKVYDHGVQLAETGLSAKFVMGLPDNEHYYRSDAIYSSGTVSITVDETYAASVSGDAFGYFQILRGDSVIASTETIMVTVLPSATDGKSEGKDYDDEIVRTIRKWLEEHPEATTTVQDDSLTTAKFKDGQITEPKMADDAVSTRVLVDGSVTTEKLGNLSVTMQKIADGSVTYDKLSGAKKMTNADIDAMF